MAQHVTFFRMKVKPGKVDELRELVRQRRDEARRLADTGWESTVAGQSKDDRNTVWVAVTYDTSEHYYANAENPDQNEWYEKMRALLESDPEWFDCDVLEEQRA